MARKTDRANSPRARWKPSKYVVLRNVSNQHIALHLPSGRQRVDVGQRLLVPPEIAHDPEVQRYVQEGKLTIEENKSTR